jgi:hypothetical protein
MKKNSGPAWRETAKPRMHPSERDHQKRHNERPPRHRDQHHGLRKRQCIIGYKSKLGRLHHFHLESAVPPRFSYPPSDPLHRHRRVPPKRRRVTISWINAHVRLSGNASRSSSTDGDSQRSPTSLPTPTRTTRCSRRPSVATTDTKARSTPQLARMHRRAVASPPRNTPAEYLSHWPTRAWGSP